MPWFKIDDGFHCHPKVLAAGTAAVGLYVRCGSWAAQQASEGVVPKAVARMYGTPRMIKALVDAGLWHAPGFNCESCKEWHPVAPKDAYLIHEYLAFNPSKEAVATARAAKAERQRRWREGRQGKASDANSEGNSHRVDANLEGNSMRVGVELDSTSGADSEQIPGQCDTDSQLSGRPASDVDASTRASRAHHGDAAPVPARPSPSLVPPTEVQLASCDGAEHLPTIGPQPRIPAAVRPLAEALTSAQMAVGWGEDTNWLIIEALIKRCGIPMLVDHARGQWQRAKTRPQGANYFIPGWRDLLDAPQADQASATPPQIGPMTRNQQKRSLLDEAAARIAGGTE
ncbi:hypothetical protein ACIRVF_07910 [Kitasatospora sp. NPDC101157]|uniref:hypothetical protein n=1 Tax=Kitasatospora sp. NPDC101157 TaxID=3364098 RepID=UPI00381353AF